MTIREISNTAKLNVIDSVRGWAILLVIIVHTAGAMSLLPYPVKKMTNLGWYGVQLFFIASAVTLLLSMHRSLDAGKPFVVGSFFRRRFWRIAPMYYFGALFYFFMRPPEEAFSFSQLLLSLTFINSWHPDWLGVTPGYWGVVPGGWSISVEFCFYALFPILAACVNNLKRAFYFLLASLFLAASSFNLAAWFYPSADLDVFSFFWLPSQLVIFALGFNVFFIVYENSNLAENIRQHFTSCKFVFIIAAITLLMLSQLGNTKHFFDHITLLPTHITIGFIFSVMLIALLIKPDVPTVMVNTLLSKLGEVSFSAYLIHFFVIDMAKTSMPDYFEASGVQSIFICLLLIVIVAVTTYIISSLTYKFIEKPFMNMSKPKVSVLAN